jgi:hypothetical protein
MSALPPKADIRCRDRHVRFVSKADIVHCSNLATDLEVEKALKAGKSFSQAASGAKYLT